MKAAFESISSGNHSFVIRRFEEKSFSAPYHFHPEFELTLILSGCGKRYVASHMHNYYPEDLVLLGSNLPHCWKTENATKKNSISIVIHFMMDFMGKDFFYKPELAQILQLLNNSNYGIHFTGNINYVKNMMVKAASEENDFKKLILIMQILHELALSKDYIILNKENVYADLSINEKERINKVMAYLVNNFQHQISLNKTAALINMTPHAFCKYFKKLSRKTFMEVVNDYRIDFAIRQLVHTNNSITDIGFDSGFNDISNFYKTFKNHTRLSPLNYRKTFLKKIM